jgi:hypothetical protein
VTEYPRPDAIHIKWKTAGATATGDAEMTLRRRAQAEIAAAERSKAARSNKRIASAAASPSKGARSLN